MRFVLLMIVLMVMNPATSQNYQQTNAKKKTAVVAHRGGSLLAPENTLAAFKNAIKLGSDFIELDVHQTSDHVTVVIHDNTLNRTTTGKGAVENITFEKLRSFDAGVKFSKDFAGEKVPTLDETLQLIDGKCNLLIEIKNSDGSGTIEKDVVNLIHKYNSKSWCVVQSFSFSSVRKVHELDQEIKTALLFVKPDVEKIRNHSDMNFLSGINIYQRFAGKKIIEKIHSLNKTVFVWTVSNPKRLQKIMANGADGIMTNDPALMKSLQD
jgi:glycerophosphoryl diester phosphodiesterase